MKYNKTITYSVYVFYANKALLHRHKKYNTLFHLGGRMREKEVPHETAIREVCEESGFEVGYIIGVRN